MSNAINWFEIPATNFEAAVDFYGKVLDGEILTQDMMGMQMGFLPAGEGNVGGAVVAGEGYKPSTEGALVYLNGGDDLNVPLSRVEAAGGKVLMPKTKISDEIGHMAIFLDNEGNRLAFHSQG